MEITKIRGSTGPDVYNAVRQELESGGFRLDNSRVAPTHVAFKVNLEVSKVGHNLSPYAEAEPYFYSGKKKTGMYRKGMSLGWSDWVWVNNHINDVLDRMNVSANVQSLKGQFVVRRGMQRFEEADWEDNKYRNVGSIMSPIMAGDAWRPAENRVLPDAAARGVRVKPYKRRRAL